MMNEFELVETWFLAGQALSNSFITSSTLIFAYTVVAHLAGRTLEQRFALGLTIVYSFTVVGSVVFARIQPTITHFYIASEYAERFPEGSAVPPLENGFTFFLVSFVFGMLPLIAGWFGSIYYMHFHIRKNFNGD